MGRLDDVRGDRERARRQPDFTGASNVPLKKPHGYVFEVPASNLPGPGQSNRKPITHAGRFAHESVSYDPKGGHLYLSEDNFEFPSGFYRYRPPRGPDEGREDARRRPAAHAQGQGQPTNAHLEAMQTTGTSYAVEWVDIAEPDVEYAYTPGEVAPTDNKTAIKLVASQGQAQGAAGFSRLEGRSTTTASLLHLHPGRRRPDRPGPTPSPVTATGSARCGPTTPSGTGCTCLFQSPDRDVLDFPDNVTTSTRGTLVVCEDNDVDNYLRGLSTRGQLFDIALNRLVSSTGTHPVQRRVRRVDVQPRRQHAVREHPGLAGHDVRDLGTLGEDRRLNALTRRS